MGDRFGPLKAGPREIYWVDLQFGSFRPIASLECPSRRNCGERVCTFETLGIGLANCFQFVEHATGFTVTTLLQVSVCEVVHRVKLVVPRAGQMILPRVFLRCVLGLNVRSYVFVPQAKPGEDV